MNKAFLTIILILFSSCSVNNKQDNLSQTISTERYIIHNDFPSNYISKRNIEVWLPNGYDDVEALPVLYMFDGQNIFHGKKAWFDNGYSHGWQVDETLDSLFDVGSVPRVIVVGIFHIGVERISEYMPAKPRTEVKKRISQVQQSVKQGYEKYGITSDQFLKFLVKELKPYAKNAKFFWCQEEPKNMGAWFSVRDYIQWTLDTIKANNNKISYIGRSPDASPATGYAKRHISQQQEIISKVFE